MVKSAGWFFLSLLALIAMAFAADSGFAVHMLIVAIAAFLVAVVTLRSANFYAIANGILKSPADQTKYDDDPIRWGVIATVFWGLAGFLAGLYIACQLAFPALNLGLEYTTFGRLRPLHTSAVIFAFGGNALIATSFYIVQRTCRARLAFPGLARFVFWGYQLFIVLAATGYLMGITEAREYAEPEWYVDLWLTVVWVSRIGAVFIGTIIKRKRTAHLCGQLVLPGVHHHRRHAASGQQLFRCRSISCSVRNPTRRSAGVQDALTQWWYGP